MSQPLMAVGVTMGPGDALTKFRGTDDLYVGAKFEDVHQQLPVVAVRDPQKVGAVALYGTAEHGEATGHMTAIRSLLVG